MNLNTEQQFSVAPHADIPRSVFDRSFSYKTTISTDYLYPIFIDEALPGDSFKMDFTVFGRIINPLVRPIIDELYLETLWFKCPIRLLWSNWTKFCGEQENPGDSIDYLIPVLNSGNGFVNETIFDYMGIPTYVPDLEFSALPFRMYNKVFNEWFRSEDLEASYPVPLGDSDSIANYALIKSNKVHDYFTSCLPFAQKFNPVSLPLGVSAPIFSNTTTVPASDVHGVYVYNSDGTVHSTTNPVSLGVSTDGYLYKSDATANSYGPAYFSMIADLSKATAATINDIRFAFQLQKFRERQARSGTRYTEFIKSSFGVSSPDARLQRTEFLGSTRDIIDINTVVQTGGSSSPNGTLTAYGVLGKRGHGFSTSFTEHSYVLGICRIRHNPTYQQGLNRMWSRTSFIDFYNPLFACIGEQPVLNKEIMAQGNSVKEADGVTIIDNEGFGFQEAWADYRYHPSIITGKLRTNDPQSLDAFHLSQYFADAQGNPKLPVLNGSFLSEAVPMQRVISVLNEPQFVLDFSFKYTCARPMPVHSVPGLIDHF